MTDLELTKWAEEVIASQFRNQEKQILKGLAGDSLLDDFSAVIARSREVFINRIEKSDRPKANVVFDAALNDFLFAENSFIPCPIW